MGDRRDRFSRFKEWDEPGGEAALQERSRQPPILKNRVPAEVEDAVGEPALAQPARGQGRVAQERRLRGLTVSPAGVRGRWRCHDAAPRRKRLTALETTVAQDGFILTEAPMGAWDTAQADQEAHGEFEREGPSSCGAHEPCSVGTRKGVGRIDQQTFIDPSSTVGFATLADRKTPVTAADLLNDRVMPCFDEHGMLFSRILTDRGTEY